MVAFSLTLPPAPALPALLLAFLALLPHPSHALSLASSPPLPLNWATAYVCATDTPTRVLTAVRTHRLANNTPAACITLCAAAAPPYTYAGVEYADECHCGMGLVLPLPDPAPTAACDMPCAGDPDLSCGGPWRIQIYRSPALPTGGSWALQGCFLDTPASPALAPPVTHRAFATDVDLVAQCVGFCARVGLPWAGVEDGADCQCGGGGFANASASTSGRGSGSGNGTSNVSGANRAGVRVGEGECNATCPLPNGAGSEYCGGFQRLMVYRYQA